MTYAPTARLGLPFWTSDSDIPTRDEFGLVTSFIDNNVMVASQGPASALPDPTVAQRAYLETDTGIVRWCTGSAWVVIGRVVDGTRTVRLISGQTAHMDEWKDASGNVMSWVDSAGGFHGFYADDAHGWDSPTSGLQPNWANAGGYYYSLNCRVSGEHVQVRGQVQRLAGALNLLTRLDEPYIPLNTQRFPVWSALSGNEGGSFTAVALVIGTKDGGGDVPGNLRLFGASGGGPIADGATLDLNLNYLVGGRRVNGVLVT
jgi:hypothetical protein